MITSLRNGEAWITGAMAKEATSRYKVGVDLVAGLELDEGVLAWILARAFLPSISTRSVVTVSRFSTALSCHGADARQAGESLP